MEARKEAISRSHVDQETDTARQPDTQMIRLGSWLPKGAPSSDISKEGHADHEISGLARDTRRRVVLPWSPALPGSLED